jgi:hypothetical protein
MKGTAMVLEIATIGRMEVQLWDQSLTRLHRFWEDGPLVLVFLRHYG